MVAPKRCSHARVRSPHDRSHDPRITQSPGDFDLNLWALVVDAKKWHTESAKLLCRQRLARLGVKPGCRV